VSLLESFGSSSSAAVLLNWNPAERYSHLGWAANAFSVRQTPPPAFAIQYRQLDGPQFGSMTLCAVRPAAMYSFGT
jgi:hypothetical protein